MLDVLLYVTCQPTCNKLVGFLLTDGAITCNKKKKNHMYCCVNLFEKSPTNMYFLSFVSLWTIIAFFGISGGTKFYQFLYMQ